jgi:thioredoxin reductase (NADPH)
MVFLSGKEVAIVGAGDTAAEEALYLAKLATTCTCLFESTKCVRVKIMQEKSV